MTSLTLLLELVENLIAARYLELSAMGILIWDHGK